MRIARRIVGALGLLALGGLAWALAPAFSAHPYLPEAKDFEQALPALERVPQAAGAAGATARGAGHEHGEHARDEAGEGPITHRSEVIEAPGRFDLAGIAGELRPYEIRAREHGGEWSKWTETVAGDPVWFGGAEELQVRTRGWVPSGELHYVNVSGDSTPAEAALNRARAALSSAVVSVSGLLGFAEAKASPPKPGFVTRRQWGANRDQGGCQPKRKPSYGGVRAIAVHHTVTATRYTRKEVRGMVLGICRYHRFANGWDDIGYNALVDRFGRVYQGRAGGMARAVIGAHAQGFNSQTAGVALLGTHTKDRISKEAMRGTVQYLAWKFVRHNKDTRGQARLVSAGGPASRYPKGKRIRTKRLVGHRRLGLTECPGDALNRQLRNMRIKTQRRIDNFPDKEPPKDPKDPKDPKGGGVSG